VITEVSWEVTPGRQVLMTMEVEKAKSSGTPLVVSQATQLAISEGLNLQQHSYDYRRSRNYFLSFLEIL
jgi:hypothetical protein